MRIGEYQIVIQSFDGEVLAEVERTAATGHPAVGEELVLDGAVYVVERVRHEEDGEARTRRRYTAPRLFVRRRPGLVDEPRRDPARAPPRVLPFPERRSRGRIESVVLPPTLVAVLVACGYEAQASHFARRGRGGLRLSRSGQGWFVAAGESPAEALQLAREARCQRRRVERWIDILERAAQAAERRAGLWLDEPSERWGRLTLHDGGVCPWPAPWWGAWWESAPRDRPSARAAARSAPDEAARAGRGGDRDRAT